MFYFEEETFSCYTFAAIMFNNIVNLILLLYTVSHKKRATLFSIITPAFLDQFLYFLYRWKQEGILYNLLI